MYMREDHISKYLELKKKCNNSKSVSAYVQQPNASELAVWIVLVSNTSVKVVP
jgi:hypothetical protein